LALFFLFWKGFKVPNPGPNMAYVYA